MSKESQAEECLSKLSFEALSPLIYGNNKCDLVFPSSTSINGVCVSPDSRLLFLSMNNARDFIPVVSAATCELVGALPLSASDTAPAKTADANQVASCICISVSKCGHFVAVSVRHSVIVYSVWLRRVVAKLHAGGDGSNNRRVVCGPAVWSPDQRLVALASSCAIFGKQARVLLFSTASANIGCVS